MKNIGILGTTFAMQVTKYGDIDIVTVNLSFKKLILLVAIAVLAVIGLIILTKKSNDSDI